MELIIHRVNKVKDLNKTNTKYGTEIDIRAYESNLILNHEPFDNGDLLVDYLDEYQHGTLILNIKESGIEDEVLRIVRERNKIQRYFLLDVEFPYLYNASRNGERSIAIRFSEDESIETIRNYVGKVDWVWIDTNTLLPISSDNKGILKEFNTCLVCPERWGRPNEIDFYKKKLNLLDMEIDCVMTSKDCAQAWERSTV